MGILFILWMLHAGYELSLKAHRSLTFEPLGPTRIRKLMNSREGSSFSLANAGDSLIATSGPTLTGIALISDSVFGQTFRTAEAMCPSRKIGVPIVNQECCDTSIREDGPDHRSAIQLRPPLPSVGQAEHKALPPG